LAALRLTLRRFHSFSATEAVAAGLMPQQHQALLIIKTRSFTELPTISDVAEQLLIRHHSAVELVNRLVKMGLVERMKDAHDARRVRLALTPLAEDKLATLAVTHLKELRAVRPFLMELLDRFGA